MDVCRWEFLAIILIALSSEIPEKDFNHQKEEDPADLTG